MTRPDPEELHEQKDAHYPCPACGAACKVRISLGHVHGRGLSVQTGRDPLAALIAFHALEVPPRGWIVPGGCARISSSRPLRGWNRPDQFCRLAKIRIRGGQGEDEAWQGR